MENIEVNPAPKINVESIEDITDLNNSDIRTIIEDAGLLSAGDTISLDDFDAIKRRALIVLQGLDKPLSSKAAVLCAYLERMQLINKVGVEDTRNFTNEVLRAILYAKVGEIYSDEEIDSYRNGSYPDLEEWAHKRNEVKKNFD
jgi:hypothetical protein